jgi:hypothetical protein
MFRGRLTKIKIDKAKFKKQVANGLKSEAIKEAAFAKAQIALSKVKAVTIQEFESHPVTKEISEGGSAVNKSGTLGGVSGNLYSFIGFYDGDDPTRQIRSYLVDKIRLFKSSRFVKYQTSGYYNFRVNAPDPRQIEALTPLPFERGQSWVRGIERGISGLGFYLHGRFSGSRSGGGIQSEHPVRPAMFSTTRYMTAIVANFYTNIRKRRF